MKRDDFIITVIWSLSVLLFIGFLFYVCKIAGERGSRRQALRECITYYMKRGVSFHDAKDICEL